VSMTWRSASGVAKEQANTIGHWKARPVGRATPCQQGVALVETWGSMDKAPLGPERHAAACRQNSGPGCWRCVDDVTERRSIAACRPLATELSASTPF